MVYACSGTYINKQLAANPKSCIQSIKSTTSDPMSGTKLNLSASFGAWQMVAGGSGIDVHFQLPVTSGSFSQLGTATSFNLSGITINIEMQLTVVADGKGHALKFNTANHSPTQPAITIVSINAQHSSIADKFPEIQAQLEEAVLQGLTDNLSQLTFVFGVFTPPATGPYQHLLYSSKVAYAYENTQAGALGGIALLATSDRRARLARAFDVALLAKGDFGFLADSQNALYNCIGDKLWQVFGGGATMGSFSLSSPTSIYGGGFRMGVMDVYTSQIAPFIRPFKLVLTGVNACSVSITALVRSLMGPSRQAPTLFTENGTFAFDATTKSVVMKIDTKTTFTVQGPISPAYAEATHANLTYKMSKEMIRLVGAGNGQLINEEAVTPTKWAGQTRVTPTDGGYHTNFYLVGNLE